MPTNTKTNKSKKDQFAGLNMPIDNKPLVERNVSGINDKPIKIEEHKSTSTQVHKVINTEGYENRRKTPNKKGNVQETIYITPDKKIKIALLSAIMGKSKGDILEEGIDYILDKYSHLLKNI